MRARHTTIAVTLAALVLVWAGGAAAGARQTGPQLKRAKLARLASGISTHYPCGNPITIRGRAKDASGNGIAGVTVYFTYKLKTGTVKRHAKTNANGVAKIGLTPTASTASDGVKVTVSLKATHNGVTRRASTWFTPHYT